MQASVLLTASISVLPGGGFNKWLSLSHAWRRLGAAAELLGGATHGRLLDTLGELMAVADDNDFLAAAGVLRTILEQ